MNTTNTFNYDVNVNGRLTANSLKSDSLQITIPSSGFATNGLEFSNNGSVFTWFLGNRWINNSGSLLHVPLSKSGTLATLDDTKETIYEIINSTTPTLTSPTIPITISTDIKLAIAENPKNVVLCVKTSSTDTYPRYFKYDRPNSYSSSTSTWSYIYKCSSGTN